jgi:hypothetical protein
MSGVSLFFVSSWSGWIGFCLGWGLSIALAGHRQKNSRTLPLPIMRQVWRIAGIGRVRVSHVSNPTMWSNGQVFFVRPLESASAAALSDADWRDDKVSICISLNEFDKVATLDE